jgi:para-nitrobenzyl esterase
MAFADIPRAGARLMPGMYALHEAAVCRRRAAGNQPWNWNSGIVSPVLAKSAGCP